ncbi:MAG: hypothetical protein U0270_17850 [Labilithrix sp.]
MGFLGVMAAACGPNGGSRPARVALAEELKPVGLKNCELKRYGSANDGGYLMCANLLKGVEALYSYGIDREDNWGCQLSKEFQLPVHQYDCFTPERPKCDGGKFVYHDECVGNKTESKPGGGGGPKPFDTIANQLKKNGDGEKKHLVVKIDVEGAEWESLTATSDDVFDRIDTLVGEFHGVGEQRFVDVIKRLKTKFWMVSVHFNNYSCSKNFEPLPARAYQILWINKRIGEMDPSVKPHVAGEPPDTPDAPQGEIDCQTIASK